MQKKKEIKGKKVFLVYAGLRICGSVVRHCIMLRGKPRYYQHLKWPIMGRMYEATENKEGVWLSPRPKDLGVWPRYSDECRKEWELQTTIAEEFRRMKRASNRNFKPIDEFLGPLRSRYHNLRTWDERDAFLSYVSRRIRDLK